jgi:uncharacterized membrane protein
MALLAFGVLLFVMLHGVAAVPPLKEKIKTLVGVGLYGPVFGVSSIIALAIIVLGWRNAEFVPLYDPPDWGWYANYILTFIGFLCLGVFLFRGNLRQRLRFPMGVAVILWATGHLCANGDLASIILFGGLLVGNIAHIVVAIGNGVSPSPETRMGHDGLSLIFGAALYGIMTQLHYALIGVPVFVLSQ